ncbi:MAG: non-heme iron oxygenase ferredoxin subunit [Gemmatimonadetes bacterium]|nr:non-heme iron oxygenase ferredoxin subunit [Gemmatimonadota bacterium]
MAEWVRVADVADCAEDGCLRAVRGNGEAIVLARWEGEFFALEDCCSHQDFPLSDGELENGRIECVFHGAKFDVRTGKAVQLPALKPVRTFPVEIRGDGVFVQIE